MGIPSLNTLKEQSTARPPEGWSTFRPTKAKGVTIKGTDRIIVGWEYEDGTAFDQWFDFTRRTSLVLLTKLCEYIGVSWEDGATIEAVGNLINEALEPMDLLIKWGNGDGVFVNDVAPAGQGGFAEGEAAPAPVAERKEAATSHKMRF